MTREVDASALLKFIQAKIADHTLNKSTGKGWLTTYHKMIGLLNDEEKHDMLKIDASLLQTKFKNKYNLSLKGSSLGVHLGRMNSMLDNFKQFIEAPQNYRGPQAKPKSVSKAKGKTSPKKPKAKNNNTEVEFSDEKLYRSFLPNGRDFVAIPAGITESEWGFVKQQLDAYVAYNSNRKELEVLDTPVAR